ncbi:MAG: HTH domain-containing protein [candidate division Zixibacteria bacterium]|nr:HTH domain-containing protein [candidate division Zixibacteria bacterium]
MNKTENILYIAYMLHEKGELKIRDIVKQCNISSRTAYRYISTLTQANIPVYYDAFSRTYRLLHRQSTSFRNLSENDILLLLGGLSQLLNDNNREYHEAVNLLLHKLIARLPSGLSSLWDIVCSAENLNDPQSITQIFIWAAVLLKIKVHIKFYENSNGNGNGGRVSYRPLILPKLVFKDQWYVYDDHDKDDKRISLSDIKHISLDTKQPR